jgi:site-specific recombinase XerC
LRLYVVHGKGAKDRVVYISLDTREALMAYVKQRLAAHVKKLFLVEKGIHKGSPISVRGIQKRMEYYARKSGLKLSCHHLRHNAEFRIMPSSVAKCSSELCCSKRVSLISA